MATNIVQTSPPGEKKPLICEDCNGYSFCLYADMQEGCIEFFHTLCTGCGKRGALMELTTVTVERKFQQFMDPPPGDLSFTVTAVPAGIGVPATDMVTTTTTIAPDADPSE